MHIYTRSTYTHLCELRHECCLCRLLALQAGLQPLLKLRQAGQLLMQLGDLSGGCCQAGLKLLVVGLQHGMASAPGNDTAGSAGEQTGGQFVVDKWQQH